jgi:hypothetical protein
MTKNKVRNPSYGAHLPWSGKDDREFIEVEVKEDDGDPKDKLMENVLSTNQSPTLLKMQKGVHPPPQYKIREYGDGTLWVAENQPKIKEGKSSYIKLKYTLPHAYKANFSIRVGREMTIYNEYEFKILKKYYPKIAKEIQETIRSELTKYHKKRKYGEP